MTVEGAPDDRSMGGQDSAVDRLGQAALEGALGDLDVP